MNDQLTSSSTSDQSDRGIEIVAIIIDAGASSVTIPIPKEAPLRCGDTETLHAVARQMESLLRALIGTAGEKRSDEPPRRNGESGAIAVW